MQLHIPTLVFIASLVFAIQTAALLVQYRVNKTYEGIGWWLTGSALQSLGFLMMLLVEVRSLILVAALANPLVVAGQILLGVGVARFLGWKEAGRVPLGLFAAYLLAYAFFIFARDSIPGRALVVYAATAAVAAMMGYKLLRGRIGQFSLSARFTASVFLAYGGFQAAMAVLTLALPPIASYDELPLVPMRVILFIMPTVVSTLWTFGFILMVNQRLNAVNLEEREKLEKVFGEHKKAEQGIRTLLAEKELILKEVHHRVKNNMATMRSLLSLQASTLKEPTAVAALNEAGSRVQSMMMLYDALYHSPSFTEMSLAHYLPSLIDEILSNFPKAAGFRVEKD
ncbi:MAG TPA: histidine kinase dimerization/phosphoacceptor domain -containing protein, partial [Rectinemataceae bacterium]|nr:histidine kinase dimerization/phosphoacceptor domain -containing protein [Rectinemataceae bacterium]